MKKIIVFLFIFMFISICINEKENIIIPKDAIRFRIIANSNSIEDQNLKLTIKSDLEKELYQLLENVNNIDDARTIITNNIDKVDNPFNDIVTTVNSKIINNAKFNNLVFSPDTNSNTLLYTASNTSNTYKYEIKI